jgi:hypothetical protein
MKSSKIVNLFTLLVAILTIFQGLLPSMSAMITAATMTVVSAILMFLVSALTTWKQTLSTEVDNKALIPTILVAVVATLGGLNDLFNLVPIGAVTGQWIRFIITSVTAVLNIASKIFWPTEQTKSLI